MKKFTFSFLFMSLAITGFCTTWTIRNSEFAFNPPTLTITHGDTVIFNLEPIHNAVEVSEATWNNNGNIQLIGGFAVPFGGGMVLPAQLPVGTHFYVCQPHASGGMKGMIIVESTTGIGDSPMLSKLSIYPNPTSGIIQWTIDNELTKNYTMEVFDLHGIKILSTSNVDVRASHEIDLSGFAKGVYYVRFRNGTEVYNRRVLVQ